LAAIIGDLSLHGPNCFHSTVLEESRSSLFSLICTVLWGSPLENYCKTAKPVSFQMLPNSE